MQSIQDKIQARIYGHGQGHAFCAKDFLRLGSRGAVDLALHRLCKGGVIRRVCSGIYDYPHVEPELGGVLGPDLHQVAKAIARKNGWRIQPSGAVAANALGLSTQVPVKAVYLTDGKTRDVAVGHRTIRFKRVAPKKLRPGSEIGILVTQALRHLGGRAVDAHALDGLSQRLTPRDFRRLRKDARYMEDWIWAVVDRATTVEVEEPGSG